MAQGMAAALILKGQELHPAIPVKNCRQIHGFIINADSQHLLCQAVADGFYQLQRTDTGLCLPNGTIRHSQFNHLNPPI